MTKPTNGGDFEPVELPRLIGPGLYNLREYANLKRSGFVEQITHLERPYKAKGGGGGSGGDGMSEERIAVLETKVGHIEADIAEIKQDIRDVKKDIKDLAVALAGVNTSISLAKWLVPVLVSLAVGIGAPLAFHLVAKLN